MAALRDQPPPERTLTTWAVGAFLALLLLVVGGLTARALAQIDARMNAAEAKAIDNERRVTALETAFAALNAANGEQHKALLAGQDRIEGTLKELIRERSRP